jgi:hypothetical protein
MIQCRYNNRYSTELEGNYSIDWDGGFLNLMLVVTLLGMKSHFM